MKESKATFKKNFISGLLIIIPAGLTYFLFSLVINAIDRVLDPLISTFFEKIGFHGNTEPYIPGLGFLIVILIIFFIGLATKNFLGRTIVSYWNKTVIKIPIVRSIYLMIKKILDTITSTDTPTDTPSLEKVVLLDYPRKGLRGLGVVCSQAKGEVAKHLNKNSVCVFIPTTPNPTTGFTVILPKEKIIPLNMEMDEVFKMILSVGMLKYTKENDIRSRDFTSN